MTKEERKQERIKCLKLLREIFGEPPNDAEDEADLPPMNKVPLFYLRDIWPHVIDYLHDLLIRSGHTDLAASLDDLQVYARCECEASYCSTVYTKPRPDDGWDEMKGITFWDKDRIDLDSRKTIAELGVTLTAPHLTGLDIVDDQIVCIEIIDDEESHRRLVAAFADEKTP